MHNESVHKAYGRYMQWFYMLVEKHIDNIAYYKSKPSWFIGDYIMQRPCAECGIYVTNVLDYASK